MRALNESKVIRRCIRKGRPDLAQRLQAQLAEFDEMKRTRPARLVALARELAAKLEAKGNGRK